MDESSMGALTSVASWTQEALRLLAIPLTGVLLTACGNNQMAFFSGDQAGQSVSLVREQAWLGGPWQNTLIVAGIPQCQRRYPLEGLAAGELRIDVYRPGSGAFILSTGERWYVTELQGCTLQAYKQAPPAPGELVGSFQVQYDKLRYTIRPSAINAAGSRSGAPLAVQ